MKSYHIIETYSKIKHKLIALYLLNVTDILFTLLFHNTGHFIELNPIMRKLLEDRIMVLTIKLIVPFGLLLYIEIRLKKASENQLKFANKLLLCLLVFYFIINLMHIYTFIMLQLYHVI